MGRARDLARWSERLAQRGFANPPRATYVPSVADVLLLDVMGTLVYDPFHEVMPSHFGMTLDELLAVKHPRAWVDFERGRLDEETFLRRFFADERPYDTAAFRAAVRSAYRFLPGIEPLLGELAQQGVPMHALSNYPCWYRMIEERVGLSRYVPWTFVSCKTGLRKPEPEAYRNAARALGVPLETCLFVDDRPANCAAAEAVGMQAMVFQGAEGLRAELASRGMLASPG
ncbi:MAG: HAD family hydrolase [Sandaracinaceae bacterium]